MKAIVTVGISGSGKSTYAESLPGFVEINRDKARWEISGCIGWKGDNPYKFDKEIEKQVTQYCTDKIETCFDYGCNIIVSDTNLNPKIRKQLIEHLRFLGYDVIIKEFPISFQEACKRDKERGIFSVGEEVLKKQWENWLLYWQDKGEGMWA